MLTYRFYTLSKPVSPDRYRFLMKTAANITIKNALCNTKAHF